jgi:hypothetical protein
MALIFPVYQRVRNVTLEDYDFTGGGANPTDIESTSNPVAGLDLGLSIKPLSAGLLCGISVTFQSNDGDTAADFEVKIFSEGEDDLDGPGIGGATGTVSELYSATFSFAGPEATVSDMLTQPIPILEQPFIRIEQTTTATDNTYLLIKFYVQSIAGN